MRPARGREKSFARKRYLSPEKISEVTLPAFFNTGSSRLEMEKKRTRVSELLNYHGRRAMVISIQKKDSKSRWKRRKSETSGAARSRNTFPAKKHWTGNADTINEFCLYKYAESNRFGICSISFAFLFLLLLPPPPFASFICAGGCFFDTKKNFSFPALYNVVASTWHV